MWGSWDKEGQCPPSNTVVVGCTDRCLTVMARLVRAMTRLVRAMTREERSLSVRHSSHSRLAGAIIIDGGVQALPIRLPSNPQAASTHRFGLGEEQMAVAQVSSTIAAHPERSLHAYTRSSAYQCH